MLAQETILSAAAIRRGLEAAATELQQSLRDQVLAAGFAGGGQGIANAWRVKYYPPGGFTLHPSAIIFTRVPDIIDAFEQGVPITAKSSKYLAWPTGYNATAGRRSAGRRGGLRVTPAEMVAAKGEAAVIPTKRGGLKLWCLRVREARTSNRAGRFTRASQAKMRLFVGGKNVEILTGRLKASARNKIVEKLLDYGYVAMFFLAKQVSERKRLDVAGTFDAADALLEAKMQAALA